jgi:hypothetical protein
MISSLIFYIKNMRNSIIGFAFLMFILFAIQMALPTAASAQTGGTCAVENGMCGGFAGTQCCSGLTCQLINSNPDATGICTSQTMTLSIITIPTKGMLPFGYQDQTFSTSIIAVGGTGAYTWQVSDGSLPPGLNLSSPTCQLKTTPCQPPAIISGMPRTMGTYTFTITVQSGKESVSQKYSLQIVDSPYAQILSMFSGNAAVYADKSGNYSISSPTLNISAVGYACCSRSVRDFSKIFFSVNDVIFNATGRLLEYFAPPGPRDPVVGFSSDLALQPGNNVVKAAVSDNFNQTASTTIKIFRKSYKIASPPNGAVFDLNSVGTGIGQFNTIKVVVKANTSSAGDIYVNGARAMLLDPLVGGDSLTWISGVSLAPGTNTITVNAPGYSGPVQDSINVTFKTTRTSPAPPPLAVSASAVSSSQIDLNITGPDYYNSPTDLRVYRNGVQLQPVLLPLMPGKFSYKYSDMGLAANTAYSYYVATYDGSLTYSPLLNKSKTVSARTWPAMSTKFKIDDKVVTTGTVNVRVTPSTGGKLVGTLAKGVQGTILSGPVWANGYWWWNVNFKSGTFVGWSVENWLSKVPGDTSPPTIPADFKAVPVSSSQINLFWSASKDNVGVAGYLLERCQGVGCTNFAALSTWTETVAYDGLLPGGFVYQYRLRAFDSAKNYSSYSNIVSATTLPEEFTLAAGNGRDFLEKNVAIGFRNYIETSPGQFTVTLQINKMYADNHLNIWFYKTYPLATVEKYVSSLGLSIVREDDLASMGYWQVVVGGIPTGQELSYKQNIQNNAMVKFVDPDYWMFLPGPEGYSDINYLKDMKMGDSENLFGRGKMTLKSVNIVDNLIKAAFVIVWSGP